MGDSIGIGKRERKKNREGKAERYKGDKKEEI